MLAQLRFQLGRTKEKRFVVPSTANSRSACQYYVSSLADPCDSLINKVNVDLHGRTCYVDVANEWHGVCLWKWMCSLKLTLRN